MAPETGYLASVLLADLADTSGRVRATRSRNAKIDLIAGRLSELAGREIEIGVSLLAGEPRQGRLGVGYRTVQQLVVEPSTPPPTLTLDEVDVTFERLTEVSGPGSQQTRLDLLQSLMGRATTSEQTFLRGLMLGELRQGALEGVMVEAVARAAEVPGTSVRRALMLSGRLPEVTVAALRDGVAGLEGFRLKLFRPIKPMLAQTAAGVTEAIEKVGNASVEAKFDGARVQVHRRDAETRVYTRNLREVTSSMPGLVTALDVVEAKSVILDGEAMTFDPDGRPLPFQETISQFSQEGSDAGTRPLVGYFFDCLLLDGEELIDAAAADRFSALEATVPAEMVVPRIVTSDPEEAEAFYEQVLGKGHEGAMVKAVESKYEAGRRGGAWLKVKPAHTLDLVVIAVEWGSGRRQGWLSNLHLGARDPATGGFVMLGKTFKGLTDETLEWQTERFLSLERDRDERTVHVEPTQVVEIAFDGVQASPRYPGGMALRFARVKQYRMDKTADGADTIDTVRHIWESTRTR